VEAVIFVYFVSTDAVMLSSDYYWIFLMMFAKKTLALQYSS